MEIPMSEAALMNRCRIVENAARNLSDKYAGRVDSRLQADINRLLNRAREYEHGTFIILVVGPAKSGKSTLVNLIAHDFVSPTGFLECTVRPSVISRRKEGTENSLTVYSSTDSANRLEHIDSIIDIIRGFGSDEDLCGILSETMPLTEDNIRRHVQLGLEKSLDSHNLLSSIRTAGGNLLQDRVFVIDMPGFDGAYQNIDNPVYETIARRADLIIFVQSSNAAFSKVSKDFLMILARTNRSVPVCLVHNVFDAAWWRDEQSKEADIEAQRLFACNEIRRMGFNIDPQHSFCINLGAVEDYRHGMSDREGKLKAAEAKYDEMERLMYDRIISRRDSMRLSNSLARVGQQRDHILDSLKAEIDAMAEVLRRYDDTARTLVDMRPRFGTSAPGVDRPDLQLVQHIVARECDSVSRGINVDIRKSNSETRQIVEDTLTAINDSLNANKDRIFGLGDITHRLYLDYSRELSGLESALASMPGFFRANLHERLAVECADDFDVSRYIKIENIVPRRRMLGIFGGSHTGMDICRYISVVRDMFAPSDDSTDIADGSVLGHAELRRLADDVNESASIVADSYRNSVITYFEEVSKSILTAILPDREKYGDERQILSELESDLRQFIV